MKVTMLLADSAQAVGGKLYILGGGWSIVGPDPTPFAIALQIEVDWTEANQPHALRSELLDEDGRPVLIPTPMGDQPCIINSGFEVGRPPGLRQGTPLTLPIAINMTSIPLRANSRFIWRCTIDDITDENWQVGFSTRPAQDTGAGA